MAAQDTIQLCAQSLYSAAALLIEKMGPKLDCDATQRAKGMREKQELALRIDRRPLHTFPVPRPADLQPAMLRLDVEIIRHPYGFAGRVENGKRQQATLRLRGKPPVDEIDQPVGRRNRRVPQLPKLAIVQGFHKILRMAVVEGYEACSEAS